MVLDFLNFQRACWAKRNWLVICLGETNHELELGCNAKPNQGLASIAWWQQKWGRSKAAMIYQLHQHACMFTLSHSWLGTACKWSPEATPMELIYLVQYCPLQLAAALWDLGSDIFQGPTTWGILSLRRSLEPSPYRNMADPWPFPQNCLQLWEAFFLLMMWASPTALTILNILDTILARI